jgi:hypothetical protein
MHNTSYNAIFDVVAFWFSFANDLLMSELKNPMPIKKIIQNSFRINS